MSDNIIRFPGKKGQPSEASKQPVESLRKQLQAVVDRQTLQLPTGFLLTAEIDPNIGEAEFDLEQFTRLLTNLFKHCVLALGQYAGELNFRASVVHHSRYHQPAFRGLTAGEYLLVQLRTQRLPSHQGEITLDPAIVALAQSLGGELQSSDQAALGLSLALYLPLQAVQMAEPLPQKSIPVLLVDDDGPLLSLATDLLHSFGYTVTACSSGAEALRFLRRDPDAFAVILTDITMPRMSGFELLEQFGAIRSDIPVVLMTGFANGLDRSALAELGVRHLLEKPFTSKQLKAALVAALAGSS